MGLLLATELRKQAASQQVKDVHKEHSYL